MNDLKIAIVVVAYNRVNSLSRLLQSLEQVDFEGDPVPLIISVDHSGSDTVPDFADAYSWKYGEKKVIRHTANLGLKNHVLSCGDLIEDYDAVVILEDDLMVSPAMYSYVRRAVQKYRDDDRIEAISLYAKMWSETAYKPFMPDFSDSDTYFIQTAESWGQVWFREKWIRFRRWYEQNSSCAFDPDTVPKNVCEWDQKSWKKYHIKYCIEQNKFTVYPYRALSTCMGDVGEHTHSSNCISQVPILPYPKSDFRFADLDSAGAVKYDAFLERITDALPDTCMDLYGEKKNYGSERYVISSRILDYRVADSYALALRPHEQNVFRRIKGNDLYRYDLQCPEKNTRKRDRELFFRYYHFSDFVSAADQMLLPELIGSVIRRFKKKVRRLFRRGG